MSSSLVLRKALDFKVGGKRKRGRPKLTWKKHVKETNKKVNLTEEDALNRSKWRKGFWTVKHGVNPCTSVNGENTDKNWNYYYY